MKRLPWKHLLDRSGREPEPETPFWLRSWSNSEVYRPQTPRNRRLRKLIIERSLENAHRIGLDRRDFLTSTMGMATALYVMNMTGCSSHDVPEEATLDAGVADALLCKGEFIFDVQTHHYMEGDWRQTNAPYSIFVNAMGSDMGREAYVRRIFLESDTTMAVLSGLPASECTEEVGSGCGLPITNDEIADTRDFVNHLSGSARMVNHAMVMPNTNLGLQLAMMEAVHRDYGVAGWKVYTPWGPNGQGFFLDDEAIGIPMIEKGLELGVNVFCCHKGLPISTFDSDHQKSQDIGVVAARLPSAHFIVYHASICAGGETNAFGQTTGGCGYGAYDPTESHPLGVNMLVRGLEDNGVGPNENVYMELGTAYRQAWDAGPGVLEHMIGKGLKYCGEDNVLWGSDVMNGPGPQDLIDHFRTLEIPKQMQEEFGYPELTAEVKAKVLGLNAARVFDVDPSEQRGRIEEEAVCQLKRDFEREFGKRRFVQAPSAPESWDGYVQHRRELAGMPG